MALRPICDSSFTCEDCNTYRADPWSPFPLRRAHPEPGPHTLREQARVKGLEGDVVTLKREAKTQLSKLNELQVEIEVASSLLLYSCYRSLSLKLSDTRAEIEVASPKSWTIQSRPYTLKPGSETLHPNPPIPCTLNPMPCTLYPIPKLRILNPKPHPTPLQTPNSKSQTLNPKP